MNQNGAYAMQVDSSYVVYHQLGWGAMSKYSTRANEEKILPSISTNTVVALPLSTTSLVLNPSSPLSYNFILRNL